MIENWFRPVPQETRKRFVSSEESLGHFIEHFDGSQRTLAEGSIALIGIEAKNANAVRQALYPLSFPFSGLQVVDLGNLRKKGVDFLAPLLKELLESRVLPVILSKDPAYLQSQFYAHLAVQSNICLNVVDEGIAIDHKGLSHSSSFLAPLLQHPKSELLHCSLLAAQSHFIAPSIFEQMDRQRFEVLRLGALRADLPAAEPYIRDADFAVFHLAALKQSEMPAVSHPSPNGLFSEEACQLARYAGMSDKLRSFGLFGFAAEQDHRQLGAQVVAQMIWYFLDGYYHRTGDFPVSKDELVEYLVDVKLLDHPLTFWRSNRSGRWWIQIPAKGKDENPDRHRLVPCSYSDYLQATRGDIPERLLQALKRFG
jgi:formiminoglutamase